MKNSITKGLSFGLTSGVITTLGLMVGLNSGTGMRNVVLSGIFTIAIADAFSDSLGIHISEEAEKKATKDVWTATLATFIGKFIFALSFAIPVLLFPLNTAIIISIIYGLIMLALLSAYIAKQENEKMWKPIVEHLLIAILVIIITHETGHLIAKMIS